MILVTYFHKMRQEKRHHLECHTKLVEGGIVLDLPLVEAEKQ